MKKIQSIAKKKHKCELCGKQIEKGEKYICIKTDFDDWIAPLELDNPYQTIHRHIECDKAWKLISDAYGTDDSFCYFYDGGTINAMYDSIADGEIDLLDFKGNETIIQNFLDKSGFTEVIKRNEAIVKKSREEWNRQLAEAMKEEDKA